MPGANEYEVWNTDSNGNYTSAATGILSGASPELQALEAYFGENFAGASSSASALTPTSASVMQGRASAAGADKASAAPPKDQTINFADLPAGSRGTADLIDPNGFSGKIENFASTDRLDLSGDWNYLHFSESSGGALGTLTLQRSRATPISRSNSLATTRRAISPSRRE